ncbi:MAG: hypothetical protein HPY53_04020 [Brevinematales bacterium]|nr:hypothetical protein [Brevinematales bacterium]
MKVKVLAVMALLTMGFMVGCDITITDTTPPNPDTIVMDFGGTGAGVFCFSNSTSQYTLKTFIMDTVFGEWNDKGFTNVDVAPGKTGMIINLDAGTYYFCMEMHNNSYSFDFTMSNSIYNTIITTSNTNFASIEPAWIGITNSSCYSVSNFIILDASTFDFCSILIEGTDDAKANHIDAGYTHTAAPYYTNWYEMIPAEIPAGMYNILTVNGILTKYFLTNSSVSLQGRKTNAFTMTSVPFLNGTWYWN